MKRATRQRVFATADSVLAAARDAGLENADFRQVGAANAAALAARLRGSFTKTGTPRGGEPLWARLSGRAMPAAFVAGDHAVAEIARVQG